MRRRLSRRRLKRQRKIIILGVFVLLFGLSAGYASFSTNVSLDMKGNIKDKSKVIKAWNYNSNEDFHTDFYRKNIVSVTFGDSASIPSNAVQKWDVSSDKKGGVMAYIVENGDEGGKYDLFISARGGVIGNSDSSYLFYNFESLSNINLIIILILKMSLICLICFLGGCRQSKHGVKPKFQI